MKWENRELGYERSEAVQRDLKRLIDSAIVNPARSITGRKSRWRILATTILPAVLVCVFFWSRTLNRPEAANKSAPSKATGAKADNDVVELTPEQSSYLVIEPVIQTTSFAGHEVLVAPDSAALLIASNYFVFVEQSKGRFTLRKVQTRPGPDGFTLIENGLRSANA